jgi:hypothetical protein
VDVWQEVSKAQAIEAIRQRAKETGRSTLHTFDRRFDGTWRSTYALEYAIVQSESVHWAPSAPYGHELVIIQDHRADAYVFVDVRRLAHAPLNTRRAEAMGTVGNPPRHLRED